MNRFFLLLLAVFSTAPAAVAQTPDSIVVGGMSRVFYLHLPATYDASGALLPLVIGLHGANQEPVDGVASFSRLTGFNAKADANGFIVVYPEGRGSRNGKELTWNGGGCCPPASALNVDDVAFIADLIDTLAARYRVDRSRVYATGISNGGIMSYRLACELSHRIAAIAPVAAAYMVQGDCIVTRPVPALHIHSLQDPALPYNGGTGVLSPNFPFPSVDSAIATWLHVCGCASIADTLHATANLLARRWSRCTPGGEVQLYATSDGGHSWPGSPVGNPSTAFNATDVIWEFFSRFSIAGALEVSGKGRAPSGAAMRVLPNPASESVTATFALDRASHVRLEVFDLRGALLATAFDGDLDAGAHRFPISVHAYPAGRIIVRCITSFGTQAELLTIAPDR
ncbi:MAG: prolyl oligopeptidase family serine peptidase [Bacteroidetes bacterium]|nr:prolyl oligopeptidase family serine peptidase [Bacteroidota bacterium]